MKDLGCPDTIHFCACASDVILLFAISQADIVIFSEGKQVIFLYILYGGKLEIIAESLNQLQQSVQFLNGRITKLEVGSTPTVHQPASFEWCKQTRWRLPSV